LPASARSELQGKRVLVFSYGSGAVATALMVVGRGVEAPNGVGKAAGSTFTLGRLAETLDIDTRLAARTCRDVPALNSALELREARYGAAGYEPSGSLDDLAPHSWYLSGVDELYRRSYARKGNA